MSATPLGLVAGTLTTAAWVPQIIRTMRLRRAEEISWSYLGVFGVGITCWLIYGFLSSSVAIIAANLATLVLVLFLISLKIRTRDIDHVLAEEPTALP